jgi:hypothetical protein
MRELVVHDPVRRCSVATRSSRTTKQPAGTKPVMSKPRKPAQPGRPKVDKTRLRELIEEATVDAYDESEQQAGFFSMLQERLDVPFETEVLGVAVQVTEIDVNDAEEIVATCKRGAHVQRVPIVDLPLPKPPPEGFEWIEAYRSFRGGRM